jgi:hypothetical protein
MGLMSLAFLGNWIILFAAQFANLKFNPQDTYVDIRNYIYFSNFLRIFPKPLIFVLFLNWRFSILPIPIVVAQIINYLIFIASLILKFLIGLNNDTPIKVIIICHFVLFVIWNIVKIIDFQIYKRNHDFLKINKK